MDGLERAPARLYFNARRAILHFMDIQKKREIQCAVGFPAAAHFAFPPINLTWTISRVIVQVDSGVLERLWRRLVLPAN